MHQVHHHRRSLSINGLFAGFMKMKLDQLVGAAAEFNGTGTGVVDLDGVVVAVVQDIQTGPLIRKSQRRQRCLLGVAYINGRLRLAGIACASPVVRSVRPRRVGEVRRTSRTVMILAALRTVPTRTRYGKRARDRR